MLCMFYIVLYYVFLCIGCVSNLYVMMVVIIVSMLFIVSVLVNLFVNVMGVVCVKVLVVVGGMWLSVCVRLLVSRFDMNGLLVNMCRLGVVDSRWLSCVCVFVVSIMLSMLMVVMIVEKCVVVLMFDVMLV